VCLYSLVLLCLILGIALHSCLNRQLLWFLETESRKIINLHSNTKCLSKGINLTCLVMEVLKMPRDVDDNIKVDIKMLQACGAKSRIKF